MNPSPITGLTEAEAAARRARGQGNDVPLAGSRSYAQILRENVFTFINNVLIGLGITLVLLGRVSDALVSVGVVLANTLVSVVQEVRAKRTLERIALLTRPRATVLREGQERAIDPAEVVLGDVLRAGPGDQIVVDGPVIGPPGARMDVDESLLTGESDLVPKRVGDPVYSGSFVVSGSALYEAQQVGAQSVAYRLTAGARAFRRVYTPLQQQINLVVRVILLLVVYFEALLAVDALIKATPLVEAVRMSVVVMGLVPNGLFLAIAAAYAVGAVRMAGQGALVQQSNAVESLSNVDVLCLDKTGTLTANRLTLHAVHPLGLPEAELRRLLGDYGASTSAPNHTTQALAKDAGGRARPLAAEVPFSSARKWSALSFAGEPGDEAPQDRPADRRVPAAYVLGAPEVLAPHLDAGPGGAWEPVRDVWAAQGLRVLLLAGSPQAISQTGAGEPTLPPHLTALGLVSLADELRPGARETLGRFAGAGIALKIISGDHAPAVAALAAQAGLGPDLKTLSGPELAALEPEQLAQAAEETTIFGRVTPQQKPLLVQALQSRAHYVAMIGDGVNDVLSLKQANLGLAMESGSAAARGVADIILLGDSFAAVPRALLEGQRIINGMQDILKLFLTRVFYAALLIVSAAIVGGFPFAPKHNTVLTLLTVGLPTLALAAWARPGMSRRSLGRRLFHFVVPAAFTLGVVSLMVYLGYLYAAAGTLRAVEPALSEVAIGGRALSMAQSALTTFTVFCGLLLIPFAEPPTRFWVGGDELSGDWRPSILALALLGSYIGVLAVPGLRDFFELAPLGVLHYLLLGGVAILWALLLRWIWRKRILERFLNFRLEE